MTIKAWSANGKEQTMYIRKSGNDAIINGNNIKFEISDIDNKYEDVYFTGSNSQMIMAKGVNTDLHVTGGNNDILVQDADTSSDVYLEGNNNSINSGENLQVDGITVYSNDTENTVNNTVLPTKDYNVTWTLTGDMFTDIYRNNIKITADNYLRFFDKDNDGSITNNDLAMIEINKDANEYVKDNAINVLKMIINGKGSNGEQLYAPLNFDLNDNEFNTVENLINLHLNIENGIDVVNSKAAINAIIASGKIKFNNKCITNINDFESVYPEYVRLFNETKDERALLVGQNEVFNNALNTYYDNYQKWVDEYGEKLNLQMTGSGAGNVKQMKKMMSTFFGSDNNNVYRGRNLQFIANDPSLPAEFRQSAINLLELNAQYLDTIVENEACSALTKQMEFCTDPAVLEYFVQKETIIANDLQTKIDELTNKGNLTAQEQTLLANYNSQLAIKQANIELYKVGDFQQALANDGLIELTVDEGQESWVSPTLLSETYLDKVNINTVQATQPVSDAVTKTITSAKFVQDSTIETSKPEKAATSVMNLYYINSGNAQQGDINFSTLQSVLSQMNVYQKINAAWLLTYLDKMETVDESSILKWNSDGSATVSLYQVDSDGTVGKRCTYTIPQNYLSDAVPALKYKGQTYGLSTGDITVRAMEIAMIMHDVDKTTVGSNTVIADRMFFGDLATVQYKNAGEYTLDDVYSAYTCVLNNIQNTTVKDVNGNDVQISKDHTYSIMDINDGVITIVNPYNTEEQSYKNKAF